MFQTIRESVSAELVEKKSKFIANLFYIESKEEAETIIQNITKKYHDAKHHCYAYRIYTKESILEKASDNGEPSGTAGAPMLTILTKNNLANILIIVTRYFGGILLGTGGLVRAYSGACNMALEKATIIHKKNAEMYKISVNYNEAESFRYFAKKNDIMILKEEYLENTIFYVAITEKNILKNMRENEIYSQKMKFIKEIYV